MPEMNVPRLAAMRAREVVRVENDGATWSVYIFDRHVASHTGAGARLSAGLIAEDLRQRLTAFAEAVAGERLKDARRLLSDGLTEVIVTVLEVDARGYSMTGPLRKWAQRVAIALRAPEKGAAS